MLHSMPQILALATDGAAAQAVGAASTASHSPGAGESAVSGVGSGVGLVVILFAAAAVATLFRRLRLQIIPGYIIAGVAISAGAGAFDISFAGLGEVTQFATVLLLFTIGLQLEFDAIRRSMLSIVGIGFGSTLASAGVGALVAMLFGFHAPSAIAVGMAMSISSTAVLLRVLQDRRELHQIHGRLTVGASIAQDLLSIVFLAALPALAAWLALSSVAPGGPAQDGIGAARMALSMLIGLAGVTVLLLLGRFALPTILALVADVGSRGSAGRSGAGSRELVLVASAAIALGAGTATKVLGFSPELGAFLAGLLLALTPFRTQLAGQFEPLRDLLMAVFFTAVGLSIDAAGLLPFLPAVVLATLVLMVLKALIIGAFAWGFGSSGSLATITGSYLAFASEFSLVVLGAALLTNPVPLLTPAEYAACVAVVVLSLIVAPFTIGLAHRLAGAMQGVGPPAWIRPVAPELRAAAGPETDPPIAQPTPAPHVIIAGFGPVGRHLAARLALQGIGFTVIELNPETVRRQAQLGRSVIYGDVTNTEVLESAGIRRAAAFVLTIPDDDAVIRAITVARSVSASTFIACRTSFLSGAFRATEAGADHVIVEEVVTADAMEKQIIERLETRLKAQELLKARPAAETNPASSTDAPSSPST